MALPTGYGYDSSESYLTRVEAISNYGKIETSKVFEDIFPTWVGVASIVGATDIFTFFDNSIDFDVNEYLIPGLEPKIHFQTGNLAGYEFAIKSFVSSTGKFVIEKNTDDKGLEIPNTNAAFQISEGDTFKILDIYLPLEYITEAEIRLFIAAKNWLDTHSVPTVLYECEPDIHYFINHPIARESWFEIGDNIKIEDPVIIDGTDTVRIVGIKRDIFIPESFQITFGNSSYRNTLASVNKKTRNNSAVLNQTVFADSTKRKSANERIRSNEYDGGRV